MKNILSFLLVLFVVSLSVAGDSPAEIGVKFMFGGRYDDLRMCVASDTGAKGGMIADIMFVSRIPMNEQWKAAIEVPVMRPILFGLKFKMLQFEPQVTFEYEKTLSADRSLVFGPGVGASFHYGPDYHSDNEENRLDSFWAFGPMVSTTIGLQGKGNRAKNRRIAIRGFYIPLFPTDDVHTTGTVLGGVLEGQFAF